MMRMIRAVLVMAGVSVALPALGGELPLMIVASDFDALIADVRQPAPPPTAQATAVRPPAAPASPAVVLAAVGAEPRVAERAPRVLK